MKPERREQERLFVAGGNSNPYNANMRDRSRGENGRYPPHEDDSELVRRARTGDRQAMEYLVTRHYKNVFNLAFRLSNNYDDAQDIVTEAFIRVQNALPSFRGDANFTTWLYRIVKNVFLDERKKQRVRSHSSLEDMVELEDNTVARQVEDPRPGPEWVVEQHERATIVQQAVGQLPANQRLMIALYHFHHRSYDEIAEIMGLPIGTVKSRLNRARLALKNKLNPDRELLES
jgi:RNA polymerase sigma-70 factor (ECF subfamily)